jgi:hypothetical protein
VTSKVRDIANAVDHFNGAEEAIAAVRTTALEGRYNPVRLGDNDPSNPYVLEKYFDDGESPESTKPGEPPNAGECLNEAEPSTGILSTSARDGGNDCLVFSADEWPTPYVPHNNSDRTNVIVAGKGDDDENRAKGLNPTDKAQTPVLMNAAEPFNGIVALKIIELLKRAVEGNTAVPLNTIVNLCDDDAGKITVA